MPCQSCDCCSSLTMGDAWRLFQCLPLAGRLIRVPPADSPRLAGVRNALSGPTASEGGAEFALQFRSLAAPCPEPPAPCPLGNSAPRDRIIWPFAAAASREARRLIAAARVGVGEVPGEPLLVAGAIGEDQIRSGLDAKLAAALLLSALLGKNGIPLAASIKPGMPLSTPPLVILLALRRVRRIEKLARMPVGPRLPDPVTFAASQAIILSKTSGEEAARLRAGCLAFLAARKKACGERKAGHSGRAGNGRRAA